RMGLQGDAEKLCGAVDAFARGDGVVDGADGAPGVEVVVDRVPYVVEGAVTMTSRSPRINSCRGNVEEIVGPVPVLSIGVVEDGEADRRRLPLLQQVADEDEVAE